MGSIDTNIDVVNVSSSVNTHLKFNNIQNFIGQEIILKGTVFKIKALKGFAFVQVFSSGEIIQCVFEGDLNTQELKEGCGIELNGMVKEAKIKDAFIHSKNCEVSFKEYKVLNTPKEGMPFDITKKLLNVKNDVKFDYRMLSMRHPKERAIFKIQEGIVRGFRDFLSKEDFTEIRSPKIVKEGAEGGANIFELKYFDRKAYLTQSPQFYKEFCVGIFERVFEVAPVFRAEKHNTNRHINEYTSMDFEMGYIESFYDIMNMETAALKYVFEHLQSNCSYEIELLGVELPELDTIPSLKFWDVKRIVNEKYKVGDIQEQDLSPIEEQKICEFVKKELNSDFLFVTHYPSEKRPFYAKDDPSNLEETLSFDLLFRGQEITTGGQRIHDFDELVEKMKSRGMNPDEFEFFSIAHKHGLPPHGGLGLGLERLTQKIIGLDNIKSATMFPRDIHRLTP